MFTREQRLLILKYGSIALLTISVMPFLMHGVFLFIFFHYYVPAALVALALYFSYTKIQDANLFDQDVMKFCKSLFTREEQ